MNEFIYCTSTVDILKKTFKRKKGVDVTYCIMDEKVYVRQGIKIIHIPLAEFALGMNIDIRAAQAIVSETVYTIEAALELIAEPEEVEVEEEKVSPERIEELLEIEKKYNEMILENEEEIEEGEVEDNVSEECEERDY